MIYKGYSCLYKVDVIVFIRIDLWMILLEWKDIEIIWIKLFFLDGRKFKLEWI